MPCAMTAVRNHVFLFPQWFAKRVNINVARIIKEPQNLYCMWSEIWICQVMSVEWKVSSLSGRPTGCEIDQWNCSFKSVRNLGLQTICDIIIHSRPLGYMVCEGTNIGCVSGDVPTKHLFLTTQQLTPGIARRDLPNMHPGSVIYIIYIYTYIIIIYIYSQSPSCEQHP